MATKKNNASSQMRSWQKLDIELATLLKAVINHFFVDKHSTSRHWFFVGGTAAMHLGYTKSIDTYRYISPPHIWRCTCYPYPGRSLQFRHFFTTMRREIIGVGTGVWAVVGSRRRSRIKKLSNSRKELHLCHAICHWKVQRCIICFLHRLQSWLGR